MRDHCRYERNLFSCGKNGIRIHVLCDLITELSSQLVASHFVNSQYTRRGEVVVMKQHLFILFKVRAHVGLLASGRSAKTNIHRTVSAPHKIVQR